MAHPSKPVWKLIFELQFILMLLLVSNAVVFRKGRVVVTAFALKRSMTLSRREGLLFVSNNAWLLQSSTRALHYPQPQSTFRGSSNIGQSTLTLSFHHHRRVSVRSSSSSSSSSSNNEEARSDDSFAATTTDDFASLGIQSPILLQRLTGTLHLQRPTAVQVAAYAAVSAGDTDVTIGSETGSGKTLAYLLPLMDDILRRKERAATTTTTANYDYARALILVPNKELVQQVLRMAVGLAGGSPQQSIIHGGGSIYTVDGATLDNNNKSNRDSPSLIPEHELVRMAVLPGGLKEPTDFPPFRRQIGPPIDLLISTPAAVGPLALSPKNIDFFADIATLVVDEADMLLDGGYIRSLENVLMGFRRADRLQNSALLIKNKTQHVFVAATLPDSGLRSVEAYLQKKFPTSTRISLPGMHNARHSGLVQQPTVWMEQDSKKDRMMQLVDMLLRPEGSLYQQKVMIFLNSVDQVESACQALQRAGVHCLPYHAKIPLEERTVTLERFCRYSITTTKAAAASASDEGVEEEEDSVPVLVCTDLASRGLDVPNVTAVVQLQFADNVVAHLHRMGRCGRMGQNAGRGFIFFGSTENALVQAVQDAEAKQDRMILPGDVMEVSPEADHGTNDNDHESGKVTAAFSRKRGFTKKRKKLRQQKQTAGEITSATGNSESI